jgi:hypothetical protein
MIRRFVLIAILALQAAAVTSVANADLPWPTCYPCPGDSQKPDPPK